MTGVGGAACWVSRPFLVLSDCALELEFCDSAAYAVPMGVPAKNVNDPLTTRMAALGVRESDLEETFVRSGGHGGQNVNKVSTCVVLLHRPSGLQVKCQTSRHQQRNRVLARELLLDKLEAQRRGRIAAERQRIEKQRRASRRPSAAAKSRMFAAKSRRAEKKSFRRSVASGD